MKRITQIISVISLLIAVLTVVLNFGVLFGRNYFLSFSVFSVIKNGGIMGFIGNLLGLLITAFAFAAMGWFGIMLTFFKKEKARKPAFISGVCVMVLAVISLFFSFANNFTFGDILVLLFPAVYTFFIIRTTEV